MLYTLKKIFEFLLFHSRFITILAVIGSLLASIVMFIKGTIKIVSAVASFCKRVIGAHETGYGSEELVAFISAVDIYLFATVLLIFSMGLYELFISEIAPASQTSDTRPSWLKISSLDDLKSSLGNVILMILIVTFFEKTLIVAYHNALDLLYLGVGILLVSAALYLKVKG